MGLAENPMTPPAEQGQGCDCLECTNRLSTGMMSSPYHQLNYGGEVIPRLGQGNFYKGHMELPHKQWESHRVLSGTSTIERDSCKAHMELLHRPWESHGSQVGGPHKS